MRARAPVLPTPVAPDIRAALNCVCRRFALLLVALVVGLGAASVSAAPESDDFASAKREALGDRNREPAYAASVGQVYDRQANALVSKCVVAERLSEHLVERKGILSLDFVIRIAAAGRVASVLGATDDPVYACIASSFSSVPFPAHPAGDFAFFVGVDIRIPKATILH